MYVLAKAITLHPTPKYNLAEVETGLCCASGRVYGIIGNVGFPMENALDRRVRGRGSVGEFGHKERERKRRIAIGTVWV